MIVLCCRMGRLVRGKSPLQLASYSVADLPVSAICSDLSTDWPIELPHAPNLLRSLLLRAF